MRILFVAMPDSIHAVRWIGQLASQGWDVHLFPATRAPIHPDLRDVTIHGLLFPRPPQLHPSVRVLNKWPLPRGIGLAGKALSTFAPGTVAPARQLAHQITRLRPDILHSLEIQHAGYLTLAARENLVASEQLAASMPPWIVTNWGSDIYHYGRMPEHAPKIRKVLSACTHYACECRRDIALANEFGFRGELFGVFPGGGGFNMATLAALRQPGSVSSRQTIAVKGYQTWAGRALTAIEAIELAADCLRNFTIKIYLCSQDVMETAQAMARRTGLQVEMIPASTHEDILRLHGSSRISIGLSISDAASTSMLEAMAMGAFPIQSGTACADEWIEDGVSGMIVPPEDAQAVATALRSAISDPRRVDRAAIINSETVAQRLANGVVEPKVIKAYRQILDR